MSLSTHEIYNMTSEEYLEFAQRELGYCIKKDFIKLLELELMALKRSKEIYTINRDMTSNTYLDEVLSVINNRIKSKTDKLQWLKGE